MTDLATPSQELLTRPVPKGTPKMAPKRSVRRHFTLFRLTLLIIALAALYWGGIASDRYVSEARLVVDRTDLASARVPDLTTMLVGSTSRQEELLMRDHLLSVDMMQKLDRALQLKQHYSDSQYDVLARLWEANRAQELFHRYFLSRIQVDMDDLSGVLVLRVEAFTPEMAHRISSMLVQEGERYMNEMGHRLARDQVAFLESQIVPMEERVKSARQAMIAFQNKHGLASPQAAAEGMITITARIEGQLSELRARRQTMLGYLSPTAPDIIQIDNSIRALEAEMAQAKSRLTSPGGGTLNSTIEEYQRLQAEAEFAQELYRTALAALEKGRIEAIRTLKKVSTLQAPTLPQYPLEPKRFYNIAAFAVIALLILSITHLAVAIIRDHKD